MTFLGAQFGRKPSPSTSLGPILCIILMTLASPGAAVDTAASSTVRGFYDALLNVMRNGQSIYLREQPFGGNELTQEIQNKFGLAPEEAEAASEREDVAQRLPSDAPRYGDRPEGPPEGGPRPAIRFPLSGSSDPTDIERPPIVPPSSSTEALDSEPSSRSAPANTCRAPV